MVWKHRTVVSELVFGSDEQDSFWLYIFFLSFYRYYATAEPYHVFPDFLPFAEKIKSKDIKFAVISNYDTRLHGILDKLNLSYFFDKIITSEEAKVSKPESPIFEFCQNQCEVHDAQPEEILHIG